MHKTMPAIIFCSTFALPATADTISGGKIKTTDTTVVRAGNKTGSLSDIKAGQAAKVEFQGLLYEPADSLRYRSYRSD